MTIILSNSLALITPDDIEAHEKPRAFFPFNETFDKGGKDITITKILVVNHYEATRVQTRHIDKLADHIEKIMNENNWDILKNGKLDKQYFSLVNSIASGHGLKTKETNNVEDRMVSFASKFCAHHNQKAPFYDSLVLGKLKHWVKTTGLRLTRHDYEEYVRVLIELQKKQKLEEFSLRHIENYLWVSAKNEKN